MPTTGSDVQIIQVWIFGAQGLLGVLVAVCLYILNSLSGMIKTQSDQFQRLNESVLRDYMPRADMLALYNAQRAAIHGCRDETNSVATRLAVLEKLFEMDHRGLIVRSAPLKEAHHGG